ncbi:MAG: hypothetical protein ACYTHJ_02535 [Planctomycetota bacterium]|jgi:hypothetical protein
MKNVNKIGLYVLMGAVLVSFSVIAAGESRKRGAPRDAKLVGRIVDMHSVMTGKFESEDKMRATRRSIMNGVPAVLETDDGVVVIGEGYRGPQDTIGKLAFQRVELHGKVYERFGIRYIDIRSAKLYAGPDVTEEQADDESAPASDDDEGEEEEDTEFGACCLDEGGCMDTDETQCLDSGGSFYADETCDTIECPN